jgi:hypothetical protein
MQHYDLLGVLVATIPMRPLADEAIRDLHHAGVRHTWLGVTKTADNEAAPVVGGIAAERHERVEPVGVGTVVGRWFHRERDETLYEALCEHGIEERLARTIDGTVAEGQFLLVAEDVIDPSLAASIVLRHGGTMIVMPDEIAQPAEPPGSDPMVETRVEAARRHPVRRGL